MSLNLNVLFGIFLKVTDMPMLLRRIFSKSTIPRLNLMTLKKLVLVFHPVHFVTFHYPKMTLFNLNDIFNTRYILTRAECDWTNYGILNIRALFIERKGERKDVSLHPEAVAWRCSVKKVF